MRIRLIPFPWLLIFLLAFLLLIAGGRIAPQDEETTFRMTANLIELGRTTITEQEYSVEPQANSGFLPSAQWREILITWATPVRDGPPYPQFSCAARSDHWLAKPTGRWLGKPLRQAC